MRQLASRMAGENCVRLTMLRLVCAVSIWRTAMTMVLPLCGAAAWWVTLICLLPGFALAALLRLAMHMTRKSTLTEGIRACLGTVGGWTVSLVLAVLLLVEGVSELTALITLFTEGVGTRGTAFTLALLTGGALLFAMHRDGLPRGVHFLRWPMTAAAVLLAACLLSKARIDHLFPLYGDGNASVLSAMKTGAGLAWPVTLLLTVPPAKQGRLRSAVLPAFSAVAALLVLSLPLPQELLAGTKGLAQPLLLPTKYATNAQRVLYLCLLMEGIFLSIGASVQLATEHLCAPLKKRSKWLPYVLLTGLILTQAWDMTLLWSLLEPLQHWLPLPLAILSVISLPMAFVRRKRL